VIHAFPSLLLNNCETCIVFRKHYSPGFAELTFGRKTTGVENLVVVFDSGSSYTYFSSQAYYTLISLVRIVKIIAL